MLPDDTETGNHKGEVMQTTSFSHTSPWNAVCIHFLFSTVLTTVTTSTRVMAL